MKLKLQATKAESSITFNQFIKLLWFTMLACFGHVSTDIGTCFSGSMKYICN